MLWTTACLGGGDDAPAPGAGPTDLCELGVSGQGLYAGQPDPSTLVLDDVARLALVTVHPDLGDGAEEGLCTGTLIDSGWVITAAHCLRDAIDGGASIQFGPRIDAPLLTLQSTLAIVHPDLDVALLQLSTTRWSELLGATPIPIWSGPISEDWLGMQLELAGRGLTEAGELGSVLFVGEPLTALHPDTLEVDGMGRSGACVGDSGGPLLVSGDDGVYVAGTLTKGAASCVGRDLYVRADRVWQWVMTRMADNPVGDADPCAGPEQP